MTPVIRGFLIVQSALFVLGAAIHSGFVGQPRDPGAAIAEAVIAVVLLAGLATSLKDERLTRKSALTSQGFALLGTLVGFTLVLTVGPTKALDVTLHLAMLATLITGLIVTYRSGRHPGSLHLGAAR